MAAVQRDAVPDYALYWSNKLMTPLTEIFERCISSAALQVSFDTCLRLCSACLLPVLEAQADGADGAADRDLSVVQMSLDTYFRLHAGCGQQLLSAGCAQAELTVFLQDLLGGAHTLARPDPTLTSLIVSPPTEKKGKGGSSARQTGLSTFYKSAAA